MSILDKNIRIYKPEQDSGWMWEMSYINTSGKTRWVAFVTEKEALEEKKRLELDEENEPT